MSYTLPIGDNTEAPAVNQTAVTAPIIATPTCEDQAFHQTPNSQPQEPNDNDITTEETLPLNTQAPVISTEWVRRYDSMMRKHPLQESDTAPLIDPPDAEAEPPSLPPPGASRAFFELELR
jgi:hypothetical protein